MTIHNQFDAMDQALAYAKSQLPNLTPEEKKFTSVFIIALLDKIGEIHAQIRIKTVGVRNVLPEVARKDIPALLARSKKVTEAIKEINPHLEDSKTPPVLKVDVPSLLK